MLNSPKLGSATTLDADFCEIVFKFEISNLGDGKKIVKNQKTQVKVIHVWVVLSLRRVSLS